jgi:hypothetical protein
LDDDRGWWCKHRARGILIRRFERFDEREPHGNYYLYADSDRRLRLRRFFADSYSDPSQQTNDQLVYCQSGEYQFECEQHAELGYDWGDKHRHHAGDLHIHVSERFN